MRSTRPNAASTVPASTLIDEKIATLGGWRGDTLARMRALIHEAAPASAPAARYACR